MADKAKDIFLKHSNEIFAYLCRLVGNHAVAEDLLSDVFVKLMLQLNKTGDEEFMWRPWLYRVACNCATSHFRKQKIRQFLHIEGFKMAASGKSAQDALQSGQEATKVKGAIMRLNHKLRSVLVMNIYQEMSYQEIADALKISIGTVKSRLNEAKGKLRIIMEESDE